MESKRNRRKQKTEKLNATKRKREEKRETR